MKEANEYRQFTARQEVDKAINTLRGIIQGIASDGEVRPQEIKELDLWCDKHKKLLPFNPFSDFVKTIKAAIADDDLTSEEIDDIEWLLQKYEHDNDSEFYDAVTAQLQELQGICHGILADGHINDTEVHVLKKWVDNNQHLSTFYPYDELYSLLSNVLEDGKVDERERTILKAHFNEFVSLNDKQLVGRVTHETQNVPIKGICAIDPEIDFDGKQFCFTGVSHNATRREIAQTIDDLGGKFINTISGKTDYLIVGGEGSDAWTFACYGRKVEKAIKLRKQGGNVVIVHEFDFWDAVEDFE